MINPTNLPFMGLSGGAPNLTIADINNIIDNDDNDSNLDQLFNSYVPLFPWPAIPMPTISMPAIPTGFRTKLKNCMVEYLFLSPTNAVIELVHTYFQLIVILGQKMKQTLKKARDLGSCLTKVHVFIIGVILVQVIFIFYGLPIFIPPPSRLLSKSTEDEKYMSYYLNQYYFGKTLDKIIPRSRGGLLEQNMQASCYPSSYGKWECVYDYDKCLPALQAVEKAAEDKKSAVTEGYLLRTEAEKTTAAEGLKEIKEVIKNYVNSKISAPSERSEERNRLVGEVRKADVGVPDVGGR